jgi:rod shape-determining protein MreB
MAQSIDSIVDGARAILETTPPEILSDIMKRGIHLVGGGALIKGLDDLLRETLNIPVTVAEDPLTAIARGAGVILEDLDKYRNVLLESEDDAYSNK